MQAGKVAGNGAVAAEGDGVGHHSVALLSHLLQRPSSQTAIEEDEQGGDKDRCEIHHGHQHQFVLYGEPAHESECQQHGNADEWQVERREYHADDSCRNDQCFVVCHLFLFYYDLRRRATGSPSCSRYLATVRRAMS